VIGRLGWRLGGDRTVSRVAWPTSQGLNPLREAALLGLMTRGRSTNGSALVSFFSPSKREQIRH
jgi:hypothetical protein